MFSCNFWLEVPTRRQKRYVAQNMKNLKDLFLMCSLIKTSIDIFMNGNSEELSALEKDMTI